MRSVLLPPGVTTLVALLLWPSLANAQVELVDPDAPQVRPAAKKKAPPPPPRASDVDPDQANDPDQASDSTDTTETTDDGIEPLPKELPRAKDAGVKPEVGSTRPPDRKEPKPPTPAGPPPATIVVKPLSDADLEQAWVRWKQVEVGTDVKAEQQARAELLAVKEKIGATDMDAWAMGLLRVSQEHEARGDSGAAVEMAVTASELAPSLPSAWVGLARAYFQADPSGVGRYLSALGTAIARVPGDPRYSQPALADLAAILILALVLTTIAVVAVLFLRRAYYFFYDFHFFFPRSASRWQTSALAVLLLALPVVFRLGLAPSLLAFFAATTLYLTTPERVVAAALIGALGLVPTLGAFAVDRTTFAGTPAEDLFALERGGPGLDPLAQRWEALAAEDKVGFAEHFVLGRYHLRRGRLEQAIGHFRKALTLNPDHVGTRVNLGVAFFLQGDLENSRSVLEGVAKESGNAKAFFNLGRLYQRRVAVYGDAAAGEVGKQLSAFSDALLADPTLPRVAGDERLTGLVDGVSLIRTVPLDRGDILALAKGGDPAVRVGSQLASMVLGDLPEFIAPFFPLLVALALVAFGRLSLTLQTARECNKCGNPVSHRGDPDVSAGSQMCTQCINVFAKKNVVAPSLKVRKQLEIARYQSRVERTGLILGALFSGMGHVFSGVPVRGAIYGFFFSLAVAGLVLRQGVLRPPFDPLPLFVRVGPMVLLAVVVYLVSLTALRRKQG